MKAGTPRFVSAGPSMGYVRRQRHANDPSRAREVWDAITELIDTNLHVVAHFLSDHDETEEEVLFQIGAQLRPKFEANPVIGATILALAMIRLVRAEHVTPDAARFRPDNTGRDN